MASLAISGGFASAGLARWRRRSVVVRRLRLAAVWAIVALATLVIGWIGVRTAISILSPSETGAEIRMSNPRFYGRDEKGRPYVIAASRAVRDADDPDLVLLTRPDMTLAMQGPQPGRLRGRTGVYNEASHVLVVQGDAVFEDGAGYVFRSQAARIDTLTREVEGRVAVTGDGPAGQTRAQSYFIHDRGARVVFVGDVHSHLVNEPPGSPAAR